MSPSSGAATAQVHLAKADAQWVRPPARPIVDVREFLPFAGATLLAFMLVPLEAQVAWEEYFVALALMLAVMIGTVLTPWERAPATARLIPPAMFLVAAAVLREAGGGFTSGVATLALLPVFWVALHGSRAGLGLTMLGVATFLAVPVLVVGEPDYPASVLETGVLFVAVSGLVGVTVQRLVGAVRVQARDGARRERQLEEAALERGRLLARLEELAKTDPLTGADNRRAWDSGLDVALADRRAQPIAVGLLDIDHFKAFNDEHGHQTGDKLLAMAARAWLAVLRPGDRLARIGGDEFAVLLTRCEPAYAETAFARLADAMPLDQTCSGGVAQWDGVESADALLRRADRALYRSKRAGRDRLEHSAMELDLSG